MEGTEEQTLRRSLWVRRRLKEKECDRDSQSSAVVRGHWVTVQELKENGNKIVI